MERFINTENIKNYRRQLGEPGINNDPIRRVMLVRLLAEELAKDDCTRRAVAYDDPLAEP